MKRAAALCMLLLLLAACAPMAPRPAGDAGAQQRWLLHRDALAAVLGFSLQGRIAEVGGRSGELHWRQRADDSFELQLNGPFGVGAVAISGDPQGVVVRTKDGSQFTPDPEAWMQANLGWSLPLGKLRAWALGQPAPGEVGALALDTDGRLLDLEQYGWRIRYDSYQPVGMLHLPRRLEAQSGNTRLRLVIDRWDALDIARS